MKIKEFIHYSKLKPWDILIIIILIISSFLPLVLFSSQKIREFDGNYSRQAVLRVDGTVIKTFDLDPNKKPYTYTYKDAHGDTNVLEIDGVRVRITEASCGDQVCVRQGWAESDGATIVCLPHKLVVEIVATDGSDSDGLIY